MTYHNLADAIPLASRGVLEIYKEIYRRMLADDQIPNLEMILIQAKLQNREAQLETLEFLAEEIREHKDRGTREMVRRCFNTGAFNEFDRLQFETYFTQEAI